MTEKIFIEDLKLNGLRVLTRVDFNVPLNKDLQITDNGRIEAALPTIRHIVEQGGGGGWHPWSIRPGSCSRRHHRVIVLLESWDGEASRGSIPRP